MQDGLRNLQGLVNEAHFARHLEHPVFEVGHFHSVCHSIVMYLNVATKAELQLPLALVSHNRMDRFHKNMACAELGPRQEFN